MTALEFAVVGARAEPYAVAPALSLQLRISETTGTPVHALALRCQIRIEPQRRTYEPEEEGRLVELFGDRSRWGETLRPFLWTHVGLTVTGFTGQTECDLVLPCTYDTEVSGTKYLTGLDGGEVPLVLLFSGTTFRRGELGFAAEPVSWRAEAAYRLPVAVWQEAMDRHFPNSAWLRVRRDLFDELGRFRAEHALPSWDDVVERLLKQAERDG